MNDVPIYVRIMHVKSHLHHRRHGATSRRRSLVVPWCHRRTRVYDDDDDGGELRVDYTRNFCQVTSYDSGSTPI
jgi:hypothetical protein